MKNVRFALAFALILGVGVSESFARGGGGGGRGGFGGGRGGYGGGESRGNDFRGNESRGDEFRGNESRGNAQGFSRENAGNDANRSNAGQGQLINGARQSGVIQSNPFATQAGARSQPFTSGWYGSHPNTWQANHPYAGDGIWAATGYGAAAGWLGISALNNNGGVYVDGTVNTGDDSDDETDDQSDDDSQASSQAANYEPQPAQAGELANSGANVANDSTWLPLGVFTLGTDKSDATAMLQLSVNKDGILRGSYYDVVSDQGQTVQGAVDKKTQHVAWTVGTKGAVTFETTLANLTQAQGQVSLHFENGQTRKWNLGRAAAPAPTDSK